jgi:hypothetical protein
MAEDGERLLSEITRFLADQRVQDAVEARTRQRWLRQMASEDGTFSGVLVDLAEQGRVVVISTTSGRRHRGRVRGVGTDFCVVETEIGLVLLARNSIAAVRLQADRRLPIPVGDRDPVLGADLATTLAGLVGDRLRVQVVTAGGDALAGALQTVNIDALTLRLDGEADAAYVPIAVIAELTLC